jgi:predicted MFS family arabinose efflux permease
MALLAGAGQVLFDMVYQAFFVALVPGESYLEANSKLSTSRSASFVVGPALGGVLIQALSAPVAVAADAVSFLFSAGAISRIRTPEAPPADDRTASMRERIATGLRFIVHDRILRASLGSSATMNFFMFVAQALVILFANRELGLSAGTIGIALGVGAGGGLATAMLARPISKALGVGRTIMLGTVLYPAPVALLTLAGGPHWVGAALLAATETVSSIGVMLYDINNNSVRAAVTPDAVRSRIAGAYTFVNYGSRPLGAVVGGWLGTAIGIRPTLLVAAVGGALGVLWLMGSPIPGMTSVPERRDSPIQSGA